MDTDVAAICTKRIHKVVLGKIISFGWRAEQRDDFFPRHAAQTMAMQKIIDHTQTNGVKTVASETRLPTGGVE